MIVFGDTGSEIVVTDWDHSPDDPFAMQIEFPTYEFTWVVSIEVLREAMADPWGIHGFGDVTMGFAEKGVYIHLESEDGKITIGFPAADARAFLELVSDEGVAQTVDDELDEFLESLND